MLGPDLSIALIVGYLAAVVFFFTRALEGGPRGILFVVLGTAVLGGAPVTRDGAEAVRCLAALTLVIFLLHMWDLHLDPCRERRLSLRGYMIFLVDYAWSVARVTNGYGVGLPWKQRGLDTAKYVAGFCLTSVDVLPKIIVAQYGFRSDNIAAQTPKRLHGNGNRV
jgi:hypothetical protein